MAIRPNILMVSPHLWKQVTLNLNNGADSVAVGDFKIGSSGDIKMDTGNGWVDFDKIGKPSSDAVPKNPDIGNNWYINGTKCFYHSVDCQTCNKRINAWVQPVCCEPDNCDSDSCENKDKWHDIDCPDCASEKWLNEILDIKKTTSVISEMKMECAPKKMRSYNV